MPQGGRPSYVQRKVAVLGYRASGKTTLTTRFVEDQFLERYDPTIENTYRKTLRYRRMLCFCNIVDTAGLDEYARLSRNALVGVHGYILVYSVVSKASFEKVRAINDALLHMAGNSPVPRVLVGTMLDLADTHQQQHQPPQPQQPQQPQQQQQRQVSSAEGQLLAERLGGIPFIECSAKRDVNVAEAFHLLLREIEQDHGYHYSHAGRGEGGQGGAQAACGIS